MSTLTICIVTAFCIGYLCIALEAVTKVNKAAIANKVVTSKAAIASMVRVTTPVQTSP